MMNRRELLATAAAASLIGPRPAAAQTTGVTPIFINWGGWYSNLAPPRQNHVQLSNPIFQFRAPWFCKVLGPERIACEGTQADVDLELLAASNAGVKAFAYVSGPSHTTPTSPVYKGFELYNSSPNKNLVKWCGYVGAEEFGNNPWSNTAAWQSHVNYWVNSHFNQTNYLKVLGGRPVLIISWHPTTWGNYFANSTANVTTAFNYLRSQSVAAGRGDPYIVSSATAWGSATDANNPSSALARPWITANADTNYVPQLFNTALPNTAAQLDTAVQAWWAKQLANATASGGKYIPNALLGWDVRPRMLIPESNSPRVPWNSHDQYFVRGTTAEVAAHLQNTINFIGANPVACDSKIMFVYAWNECSEGGTTGIPTLGDPPTGSPPTTALLSAIKPVLTAAA